ncbi:epididymal sperm-binding protein 1-like [Monodelphis domestica]|uniref:epididymal sperm-binding protein 1-like n=1 Tax=Monodelphis domestica TaxID=13616 RepID=UPI0024E1A784|nr:epididymal sperm-binding protein 1-like [Monodelphis domestica]
MVEKQMPLDPGLTPFQPALIFSLERLLRPCAFPFIYQNVKYDHCTTANSDYAWCSVEHIFDGKWRYCTSTGESLCHCFGFCATPSPIPSPIDFKNRAIIHLELREFCYGTFFTEEQEQAAEGLEPVPYWNGRYPPPCMFPFLFGSKWYHDCTADGYVLGKTWCALTHNYNLNGLWKQCSPNGKKARGGSPLLTYYHHHPHHYHTKALWDYQEQL